MKFRIISYILCLLFSITSCTSFIPRTKLDSYNGKIEGDLTIYIYKTDFVFADENDDNTKWFETLRTELEKGFSKLGIKTNITILSSNIASNLQTSATDISNKENLILLIKQDGNEEFTNSKYKWFYLMVTLVDNTANKEVWKAKINSMIKQGSVKYTKSTSEYLITVLEKDGLI